MPMQRRPQRPNHTGRSGSLRRGEMEELENSLPPKKSIQPGMWSNNIKMGKMS